MDLYHIWCDLKPGVSDATLVESASKYLGHLKSGGRIESWRLTRRKLGLGAAGLGEFHIIIETKDLASSSRRSSTSPRAASRWRACTTA